MIGTYLYNICDRIVGRMYDDILKSLFVINFFFRKTRHTDEILGRDNAPFLIFIK